MAVDGDPYHTLERLRGVTGKVTQGRVRGQVVEIG